MPPFHHNPPNFNASTNSNRVRPNFQGPSRTQQMFRALPRSNMSTGFRIPPRQSVDLKPRYDYPQPMSGISHPVARPLPPAPIYKRPHDWRIHGNPPPNNYFKTRELNSNECYDQDHYTVNYDDYENYYYDYENYDSLDYYNYIPNEDVRPAIQDDNIEDQDFPKNSKKTAPE